VLVGQASAQRVVPGRVDVDPIALAEVADPVSRLEHLDVSPRPDQSVRHVQPAQARTRHDDPHLVSSQSLIIFVSHYLSH
jgi:hypothetical protein